MIRPALFAALLVTPLTLAAHMGVAQEAGALDALSAAQLEQAATSGQAEAQFALAERYHAGDGVLQNFRTALVWYERAAAQGHAEAQNRLGQYHHAGLAGPRDAQAALRWLTAAADQGAPQHHHDLALALEQEGDPETAARHYAQAAEQGHVEAATSLGVLYQNGAGVAQDPLRAAALYAQAAEQGDARAQNNLGLLYVRGEGVAQNYEIAAQLFAAAAEQGLAVAIGNLATMYANGFGVMQSDARAAALEKQASALRQDAAAGDAALGPDPAGCLFDPRLADPGSDPDLVKAERRAAESGDPVALFLQGWRLCETALSDDQVDPGQRIAALRQARMRFHAAADRGHGPAMANLGQFHIRGLGVPQDYVLGYMWLILAGSAGVDGMPAQSAALRQRMSANQVEEAQARADEIWRSRPTP